MELTELHVLLKDLQALNKECEWVEFKVNDCEPDEIGKNISALSNSACYLNQQYAYLVYGIENETHRLIGTNFSAKRKLIGSQELENWLATQLNPRIDFNIHEFIYEGNHFVLFVIDGATNQPVSFKGKPFVRIGSYTKPLSDHPERQRKIWAKGSEVVFEKGIAKKDVQKLEILNLINVKKYFEMIGMALPTDPNRIIEKFLDDKIIIKKGDNYNITNLGAILFANNIDQFDTITRKSIRVIVYDGISKHKSIKEKVGKHGYAIGFEGLIEYILGALPSNEVIDDALRKVVYLYPPLAIRELVANAIIHQDFNIKGASPMVEIYSNRIEITNPGKPIIDHMRFIDHSPQSRNEILARFMRRLKICEERGSGIDKVVFECEYHQLPPHDTIVGDNYTRIILYAPRPLGKMDKENKIRACYLHACLKTVNGEKMTNQSLRQRFAIAEQNYSIASRIISDAKEANLIKDYDPESKSKKDAKYLPFWA
ncbi:MAG: ATP-binding protein [Bacteroidota bacterium]